MSIATPQAAPPDQDDVHYPASDGQPMGETGLHVRAILQLFGEFLDHLPETDFVAADMFWYWEKGNPESCVAPDVMVVKGIGRAQRRSFFTWRENGAVPSIVFEMASQNTWREDVGEKRRLYERLGVREYILFDPEDEYLRPRLQGFRLIEGRYEPIQLDADDRLRSEELGLLFGAEGIFLQLFDATTGARIPPLEERARTARLNAEQARQNAEQERRRADQERVNAEQERRRADQERVNAEQERLRADQERVNADQERVNAEQERRRADQERVNAEQERLRADALASEVKRLTALLEQARGEAGPDPGSP